MLEFNAKKVAKVKSVDPDTSYSTEGIKGGSFASPAARRISRH